MNVNHSSNRANHRIFDRFPDIVISNPKTESTPTEKQNAVNSFPSFSLFPDIRDTTPSENINNMLISGGIEFEFIGSI
jgi:hypothetical protein